MFLLLQRRLDLRIILRISVEKNLKLGLNYIGYVNNKIYSTRLPAVHTHVNSVTTWFAVTYVTQLEDYQVQVGFIYSELSTYQSSQKNGAVPNQTLFG